MAKKKSKAKNSPKVFVDKNTYHTLYVILLGICFALWAVYFGWTTYWSINHGRILIIDLGIQMLILWKLLDTALTRVTYTLDENGLTMVKKGFLRKKELSIPYDHIYGVHHFKNQLMKPMGYRYTYHQYSVLDNRPIWSLLYDIGSTEKAGRVMMKASEAFWREFEKRLPGQIRIPQEEVIAFTYKSMENRLREQGYFEKHPEMDLEEGIEQLRQEGSITGGKDYELTGDNFKDEAVDEKDEASDEEYEEVVEEEIIEVPEDEIEDGEEVIEEVVEEEPVEEKETDKDKK